MQEVNLFSIYTDILNKHGFQYFITGSVASIVYGEPRLTHDIDLVINLPHNAVDKFILAFPPDLFYCPPEEIIKTELNRSVRGHFNLIHHQTGFKADIYFTGSDAFQLWAFKNRRTIEFNGQIIFVAPPEYVITKKLEFYKESGPAGQKHITDIQGILNNSNDLIDRSLLQKKISESGLDETWRAVKKDF